MKKIDVASDPNRLVFRAKVVFNFAFSLIHSSRNFPMLSIDPGVEHKRTAILVVHGIGSQRALETVRGVIRGVWRNKGNPDDKGNKLWTHPEKSGVDIDLTVMTTSEVPGSADKRVVDFHELYWAHLMSETKAVAVLLWLYELCRKGPVMRTGLNGLWWAASIFLCLMNLSFAVLAIRGVLLFSETSAQNILIAPLLLILCSLVFGLYVALKWQALRLVLWLAAFCVAGFAAGLGYLWLEGTFPGGNGFLDGAEILTLIGLPTLDALLATYLVMGQQGLRAFWRTLAVSLLVSLAFIWARSALVRQIAGRNGAQGLALGIEFALERPDRIWCDRHLSRRQRCVPPALSRRCRALFPRLTGQCRRSSGHPEGGRGHAGAPA
ncbi:hypothetical protein ABIG06_002619 [Bradyrhizobium sp. USDA 326]|uniref:hypothetical protein n=1 Tax=Bradyrhizobium sp. USDA 326 TaxID=3377726 RepID=UPI003C75D0A6